MRTNTEDEKWPVVLVVAGEHELSDLIFEIARQQTYEKEFYYDVVETQKQAIARVKQLAEKGREVIGVLTDKSKLEMKLPIVQVETGEVTAWCKTIPDGKLWGKATKELLELNKLLLEINYSNEIKNRMITPSTEYSAYEVLA